MKSLSFYTVTC